MSRLLLLPLDFLSALGVGVGAGPSVAWVVEVVGLAVVEFEVAMTESVSLSKPGLSLVVMSLEPARAEMDFVRSRGMVGKSGLSYRIKV